MGDSDADSDNPVLKEEQDAQVSIMMNFLSNFEVNQKMLSLCNYVFV